MNPGVVEETGKVATGVVDAMRTQPLAIALVVVNVLFLIVGGYFMHDFFGSLKITMGARDELVRDLINAVAACPGAVDFPHQSTSKVKP